MTGTARIPSLAAAAVLAVSPLLVPSPTQAAAVDRPIRVCAPVFATATGRDLGAGRTEATLRVGSTVVATSAATFTLSPPVDGVAGFAGPIVLTPVVAVGTLTAQVQGSFDTGTGRFTARSTSLTGTGLLRRVTGHLTFRGTEDATMAFTETVTGRLCTPVPG